MELDQTLIARFWEKVDKTPGQGPNGDCWTWKAAITESTGYGKIFIGKNKRMDAHRFVCVYIHQYDMKGLDARHKCDFRKCVRPDHIEKGTRKENMQDCIKRGRFANNSTNFGKGQVGEKNSQAKLNPEKVREIRERGKREHQISLAKAFGVSKDAIYDVLHYRTWKHVDPRDEYKGGDK